MLKKIYIFISAVMFCGAASAQDLPIDPESKKITYTEVIQMEGVSQAEIMKRAKSWMATGLGSTKSSIELDDAENGKLLGKAVLPLSVKNPPMGRFEVGIVTYTVTLLAKDGRYKYVFTDFIHDSGGVDNVVSSGPLEPNKTAVKAITRNMPTQYQWKQIKIETDEVVGKQIAALKKAMEKKEADF